MKKILILSHEASLTGAPFFLLNLSKELKKTKKFKLLFFFNKSGPLTEEFKDLGLVYNLNFFNNQKPFFFKLLIRVFPLYRVRNQILKLKFRIFNPDIIISNTIVNSNLLNYVGLMTNRLITLTHEMKGVINLFDHLKMNDSKSVIKKTKLFIADSKAVKKDLVEYFKVNPLKVEIIHPYLNLLNRKEMKSEEIDNWKKINGIPISSFIVGTCASPIWRKGPDIFLNTVKKIATKHNKENIFFIWFGGDRNSASFLDFHVEVENLKLKNYVKVFPSSKELKFFYKSLDILFCTSREEPFGLTIFEAGLSKIPCLAFEKSGGPEEILSDNNGIIIPYGDFSKAADEIVKIKNNEKIRGKYSKAIYNYTTLHSAEKNINKYKEIIDNFIK
jgi:glycosyltransferase involved in cell wall biosynthesis